MNNDLKQINYRNQSGSTILIVMIVLIAITALSLTMMTFTSQDVNMSGSYKFEKIAFYNGDSGIYGTPKFIRLIWPEADPTLIADPTRAGCVQFLNTTEADEANEIMNRIYAFEGRDATASLNDDIDAEESSDAADISMSGCNIPAEVNIITAAPEHMSGDGSEFGAGAEGLGGGITQMRKFRMVSTGSDDAGNTHTIRAIYRWVNVPGGL